MTRHQKTWTVSDLRHVPPGALQYCRECGGHYSTHPGDYFLLAPDHVLTCCETPIVMVYVRTVITEIPKERRV